MQNRKFRLSLKAAAWEMSIIFLVIPFLCVSFFAGFLATGVIQKNEDGVMERGISFFFGSIALLIGILSLFLVLIAIGRAIFSYLLLSSEGLEYRLWPMHKIRCAWADMEQIKKSALPLQGDILMLKSAEVSGLQKILLGVNKGNLGSIKTMPVIPLYQISGWKSGELRTELEKHAPHLFTNQQST